MSGKSTNTFVDKPTTSTFNSSLTAESVRLWEGVGISRLQMISRRTADKILRRS